MGCPIYICYGYYNMKIVYWWLGSFETPNRPQIGRSMCIVLMTISHNDIWNLINCKVIPFPLNSKAKQNTSNITWMMKCSIEVPGSYRQPSHRILDVEWVWQTWAPHSVQQVFTLQSLACASFLCCRHIPSDCLLHVHVSKCDQSSLRILAQTFWLLDTTADFTLY